MAIVEIGGATGQGLSVSPDGRYIAFESHVADVAANTYRVQWNVGSADGGRLAVAVGDGGDAILFRRVEDNGFTSGAWMSEAPAWSPDSMWIYYRRMVDGEVQVWRSMRTGARQEQVTRDAADVEHFLISPDGATLLYAVDAPRQEKRDAARLASGRGFLFDSEADWSTRDARPLQPRYALVGGVPQYRSLRLADGSARAATEQETDLYIRTRSPVPEDVGLVGEGARKVVTSPDGKLRAWLAPAEPGKQGLQPPMGLSVSRSSGLSGSVRCPAAECAGMIEDGIADWGTLRQALWWSPDSRELYFVRREGANFGRTSLYAWTVSSTRVRPVYSTDGWLTDCTQAAGGRAICFLETPRHPRSVIAIDLRTRAVRTVADLNPDFGKLPLGDVERIEWSATGGERTYGYLVKPVGYRAGLRYPLIIVGYRAKRALRGGTGDEYPVHSFAANGFMVLCYDAPEAWDVIATTKDADEMLERTWDRDLLDVSVAADALAAVIGILDRKGLIDASKVGITGFSNGSSQASYALIHSKLFAAASLSNIMWSPVGYYVGGANAKGRAFLHRLGFGPLGGPDDRSWKPVSLDMNVDRIDTPILINASDAEYHAAMATVVSFADAGKPVEMYVYPDEHHVKWYPAHRQEIWVRNVDWFNYWLNGKEDGSAEKRRQYERWRALRHSHETDSVQRR